MTRLVGAALARLATLLPLEAASQSRDRGPALAFSLGAGVGSVPGYFGSDEAELSPEIAFDFGAVRLGPFSFGDAGPEEIEEGFGFRGSARYVPKRSPDDYHELEGLEDADAAIEVGGGVSFARSWWEVFAVGRFAIGGHESVVGELGMDLIARPSDRFTLSAGLRILIGSDDYAKTYFSVSIQEAAASSYEAFDATGGVLSSGVEVEATYQLTAAWALEGNVHLERLQNDAADSPITAENDQLSTNFAVTRRFNFGV